MNGGRAGLGRWQRRVGGATWRAVASAVAIALVAALMLVGLPGRASAGPWAGSMALGDYAGRNNPDGVAQFASTTGSNVTMATDFLDGSSTWSTLESADGVGAWAGSGYQLVLAVPMLPRRASASLGRGARGLYNQYFVTLARNLVDAGEGNAFLRLGWEFNGTWYKWKVRNASTAAAFAAYFQNIVRSMRSVPGADFKFVWNPSAGGRWGRYSPSQAYPGSAYVDYIGTDVYDESWAQPRTPQNAWSGYVSGPWGLDWLSSFAAAEGKPIAFPEWGVAIRNDGHGMGDDPYFVDQFASWITSHDVAWTGIFSFDAAQQDDITDGSFPNALAAFESDFG
jgi:hypothetical protein